MIKPISTLFHSLLATIALAITASAAEEAINQQVDTAPGGKLVVDVDFGKIEVTAGSDDKVTIEARRRVEFGNEAREKEYLAAAPVTVNKDGNTVTVRSHSSKRENFWNLGHSRMDGQYTIHMPRNFNADLHTDGGAIKASELTGVLKAETSGGDVRLIHLQGTLNAMTSGGSIEANGCSGPIDIETSGGEISATESSGTLHARTSGGSIEVHNFSGDTDVKTSGGELTLENIGGKIIGRTSGGAISASVAGSNVSEVKLESSGGGIVLSLPATAAVDITATTSAGTVSSNLPLTLISADQEHLRGKLNGGGKPVFLRTSAGSINIKSTASETAAR